MKRTGPTKLSLRMLIKKLTKKAKSEKQKIWKAVAEKLAKPSRQRITVNVSKLNFFSKKFPEKTFIVPGKVLADGELEKEIQVIALSYSAKAKKTINEKGKAMLLKDVIEKKFEASKLMITT